MPIFKQLQDIMATALELPLDVIQETSTMGDIEEWDSLGHVHIMVALEQAFDLYIDVEDFEKLNSVPAILQYLSLENVGQDLS
jgi:acyl carrier protein